MTMSPPPPPAANDLYYATPQPSSGRPTSVTVLAIIGIILGSLAVLCSPFALLPYFVQMGPPNPAIDAMKQDHALVTFLVISTAIGWIFSVLLLSSSIGSLMLKPWARQGMIVYAWIALVQVVIGFFINVMWVFPKMKAAVGNQPGAMAGAIGGLIGSVIGAIFPVFILIYMNKPHVKQAFGITGSSSSTGLPYPPP